MPRGRDGIPISRDPYTSRVPTPLCIIAVETDILSQQLEVGLVSQVDRQAPAVFAVAGVVSGFTFLEA